MARTFEMVCVPVDVATTPTNGYAMVNRWWTVHPERGVVFARWRDGEVSPQCNPSESMSKRLTQQLWPDCESRFIPVVFMEHACRAATAAKGWRG